MQFTKLSKNKLVKLENVIVIYIFKTCLVIFFKRYFTKK